MDKTIIEILETAGLDIRNNVDDAEWFVGRVDEISELIEECSSLVEKAHED